MSELVLTEMPGNGSENLVNGVATGTPVFIWHPKENVNNVMVHNSKNKANILFVKKSIGMFNIEKENQDVVDWLTNQGKPHAYLDAKIAEMKDYNMKICEFILDTLHKLTWQVFSNENHYGTCRLTTINVNDAFKLLMPAYKTLQDIYAELLEEKYPSKLVATGIKHAVEQTKLEVSQKTGKLLK